MQTGDILLFDERPNGCLRCLDNFIKFFTCSKFSHSALIVVDPPWTNLKGVYVWESSWHGTPDPQDKRVKFGVQLTPLTFYTERYPGDVTIYHRRAPKRVAERLQQELTRIHTLVYDKPYDYNPCHWIEVWCRCSRRQDRSFFCSAFVVFVLNEAGVVTANWDNFTASDLQRYPSTYGKTTMLRIS